MHNRMPEEMRKEIKEIVLTDLRKRVALKGQSLVLNRDRIMKHKPVCLLANIVFSDEGPAPDGFQVAAKKLVAVPNEYDELRAFHFHSKETQSVIEAMVNMKNIDAPSRGLTYTYYGPGTKPYPKPCRGGYFCVPMKSNAEGACLGTHSRDHGAQARTTAEYDTLSERNECAVALLMLNVKDTRTDEGYLPEVAGAVLYAHNKKTDGKNITKAWYRNRGKECGPICTTFGFKPPVATPAAEDARVSVLLTELQDLFRFRRRDSERRKRKIEDLEERDRKRQKHMAELDAQSLKMLSMEQDAAKDRKTIAGLRTQLREKTEGLEEQLRKRKDTIETLMSERERCSQKLLQKEAALGQQAKLIESLKQADQIQADQIRYLTKRAVERQAKHIKILKTAKYTHGELGKLHKISGTQADQIRDLKKRLAAGKESIVKLEKARAQRDATIDEQHGVIVELRKLRDQQAERIESLAKIGETKAKRVETLEKLVIQQDTTIDKQSKKMSAASEKRKKLLEGIENELCQMHKYMDEWSKEIRTVDHATTK